jgi:NAD(P)-dependent dehydrogenase (short-subunit alcohol dehydrogenase family)
VSGKFISSCDAFSGLQTSYIHNLMEKDQMSDYQNMPVTIIGASRGLGRTMAESFHRRGAKVLAVARGQEGLDDLARELPGLAVLACDAVSLEAPEKVFAAQRPQILVLCAGGIPPHQTLSEIDWDTFNGNWNSDTRTSFNFLKAALKERLPSAATIVTITSGAMLNGSPISGPYAGAKKMQQFLSGYAQREAGRMGLNLRFLTLAPGRMMPGTGVGGAGIAGYAAYNKQSKTDFLAAMVPYLTPDAVADSLFGLLPEAQGGSHFVVSPDGTTPLT